MAFGPSIVKKVSMDEIAFVFWRLAVAALLYGILLLASGKRLSLDDIRRSTLGGLLFGVNLVFFIFALRRTSAANAVVISSLQPVVLLAVAGPMFGERPSRTIYGWSVVAFGGVVLAMYGSDASGVATRQGDLLALVMMLLFSAYYVASKRARETVASTNYQLALTLVALVTVVPFALVMEGGVALPESDDWFLIIAMAALPGAGHLLTNYAHGHTTLTMMSLINLLFTAVAPLYAWWLVGERIGGLQAVGLGIVMASLAFVVTRPVEVLDRA
jgi:drug/metabolite transporter (DMT)-like permease